ncbi:growth arrest and DNA damage-inducible protein GADD45 alpha-like [Limulus polyphemus]|uniref:Growth arrest and DNA damage-inducible protein GADD45 alpha-like n=1 Tax=Limulus polyphemus TaxID=6850 RepID=A0ABM1TNG8_LIMPO|nr:growth arrest and DNA damage-inducible protein GADD45 alpha-like [Limulus polyphemus]
MLARFQPTIKMNTSNSCNETVNCNLISQDSPGELLKKFLTEAKLKRQLVCGVYHAAQALERTPSSILLCILTEDSLHDVEACIHSILIQAFCNANNIDLVKVDSEKKLSSLISHHSSQRHSKRDHQCVLVKNLKEGFGQPGQEFMQYFTQTYGILHPPPVIALPG